MELMCHWDSHVKASKTDRHRGTSLRKDRNKYFGIWYKPTTRKESQVIWDEDLENSCYVPKNEKPQTSKIMSKKWEEERKSS